MEGKCSPRCNRKKIRCVIPEELSEFLGKIWILIFQFRLYRIYTFRYIECIYVQLYRINIFDYIEYIYIYIQLYRIYIQLYRLYIYYIELFHGGFGGFAPLN